MENRENPSPKNSPTSNNNNGPSLPQFLQTQPLTPKHNLRSDQANSPYPTTFVQADASTFKQVVQMLTGSPETARNHHHNHRAPPPDPPYRSSIPPIRAAPRRQSFKLYERRSHAHHFKSSFVINTLSGGAAAAQVLSPSVLDFPKLAINSPVTPLGGDPFGRSSGGSSEEERAIAEKGFYLHPSPRDGGEPQLLSLFPVTSPGVRN